MRMILDTNALLHWVVVFVFPISKISIPRTTEASPAWLHVQNGFLKLGQLAVLLGGLFTGIPLDG